MSKYVLTLDEWIQEHDKTFLRDQIKCHVEQFFDEDEDDLVDDLVRLIMISVRQEENDKKN